MFWLKTCSRIWAFALGCKIESSSIAVVLWSRRLSADMMINSKIQKPSTVTMKKRLIELPLAKSLFSIGGGQSAWCYHRRISDTVDRRLSVGSADLIVRGVLFKRRERLKVE